MTTPTLDRRRTSRHEAAHVVGAALGGHLVADTRADWPDQSSYGTTTWAWRDGRITRKQCVDFLIAVLLGPLAVNESGWPPAFDQLDRGAPGDAGQAAAASSYLQLSEAAWNEITRFAEALLRNPEVATMIDLVSRALELSERLDADDIYQLLGPDRCRQLKIEPPRKDEDTTCNT